MRRRVRQPVGAVALALAWLASPAVVAAQSRAVPHPRDVLGFTPGGDYRIADFAQIREYFLRLDAASDRVRVEVAGRSTEGREMLLVLISSEANLREAGRYRDVARALALAEGLPDDGARALARDGRAIVWIDNGLHAEETAHAQHSLLLAHHVVTDESEEVRRIRDNVILLLLPTVNPDGLDLVADWYRRTVHTPHQDSPMPWLANTYAGYENNRDFYMQNLEETRVVNRLLYHDWFPQIVYNQHQGYYPTRMFVPPFPDPYNPNIDPGVLRGIELVGAAIQHRMEREEKDGVISRVGFSLWYDGSLRSTASFHNMIGILTETTHDTPSPFYYDPADMPERFGNGWSAREPSVNYPRPWGGGTLRFRDPIAYMLSGSLAVLDVAARYREEFLYGIYQMGARQIALGGTEAPFAYVLPPAQHDPPVVATFLEILMRGGVRIERAAAPFEADGRQFPAGSYVIPLAQPFRPFVKDMMEPQRYPEVRRYSGGPPVGPYDNAGWTLAYQMGVHAVPVEAPFEAQLERLVEFPRAMGRIGGRAGFGYAIDPRHNNAFVALNRLLAADYRALRASGPLALNEDTLPPGAIVVQRQRGSDTLLAQLSAELGLGVRGLARRPAVHLAPIRRPPRIGVYKSWVVEWVDNYTASEGWTRLVLESHGFAYASLSNQDIRGGRLAAEFDVIVVPNQAADDIVGGYRAGRPQFGQPHQNLPPVEYQGGIGPEGVAALRDFVERGGTLILVDQSADLALDHFDLPVRELLRPLSAEQFFGPGSIVRIDTDPNDPLAWGMPETTAAYFRKSRAFAAAGPGATSFVRYAEGDVLLSGWLLGGERVAGTGAAVAVTLGRGRVILFGFSPYFRAQPHATFKLFFNALYGGIEGIGG